MADDVVLNKAATIERCVARARNVFDLLAQAERIDAALAEALKKMVGFRNIAVHDYQTLLLPITVSVITEHLDEFLQLTAALLKHDGQGY
jgi:uncharacterized protein YutE (UPF0331/DUF86 family)